MQVGISTVFSLFPAGRSRPVRYALAALVTALGGMAGAAWADAGAMQRVGSKSEPLLLAQASAARSTAAADLEALVKAAKAEGDMTYYIDLTENVANRVGAAFTAKYGIRTSFIRLPGVPLQQRYSSEAAAGNIPANLLVTSNSLPFAAEAIKQGWLEPIGEAGLPVLKSGEFPSRLVLGPVATVQITPWLFAYNTDKLKGDQIPKDWSDVLKPQFKGQVLLPDPRVAGAYIDFWSLILDRYGQTYIDQLRANNLRLYPGGVPAVQALAAGEGSILFPAVAPQVAGAKAKGGPVDVAVMDRTTGVEAMVMLTARAKSKAPNAGRLFANYLMSQEGNAVLNGDPGGFTIYELNKLPKGYESPKPYPPSRRDEIGRMLGFQ
jgi:iron(III) transport system substrate-binding protein